MRTLLALVLTLTAATASAQYVEQQFIQVRKPVRIDGEWVWNGTDWGYPANYLIAYAGIAPVNGTPTLRFPNGGMVYGWTWQAVCRANNHVVLMSLAILRANGTVETLHSDILGGKPTDHDNPEGVMSPKGVAFARLKPGDIVFLGGFGWGDFMPEYGAVEIQAHVFVDEGTKVEIVQ